MKNNTLSGRYCFKNPRFKQIFRIMRISTFLLMVCVFCSYAGNAHSQNAKVSIRMNNVKLDKILNEIENQTDYLFIYNNFPLYSCLVSITKAYVSNNITSIVGKKYIAFFIHFKSARISQILHTFASVNFRNQ